MTVEIILIVLYALLTLALVTMKALKISNRRRGVVKMITAAIGGVKPCFLACSLLTIYFD